MRFVAYPEGLMSSVVDLVTTVQHLVMEKSPHGSLVNLCQDQRIFAERVLHNLAYLNSRPVDSRQDFRAVVRQTQVDLQTLRAVTHAMLYGDAVLGVARVSCHDIRGHLREIHELARLSQVIIRTAHEHIERFKTGESSASQELDSTKPKSPALVA